MPHSITVRDMFWFALFHAGAIFAVALFSGCATGPLKHAPLIGKKDSIDSISERKTRLQYQLGQARMHEQSDRKEKARAIYEQLVRDFPDQPEAFHRLAIVKDNDKQHAEAQRLYLLAMQLDPGNAQLSNDLGYSYFLSGNLSQAKPMLEKAVAMAPSNKLYRNNLGMTLGHMGMYQPALDQFVAASGEDDAYYNLAFVYSTQQQFDKAKECFRRALQINPRHEQARLALGSFEQFEKNPEMSTDEMLAATEKGGIWRPYKEEGQDGAVEQASFTQQPLTDESNVTNGFGGENETLSDSAMATRAQLQARANSLMQRRMSTMDNSASRKSMTLDAFDAGY